MKMQIETAQKLHVSQKLIQSSQILSMNTLALRQYLENLSFENPLIEIEDSYNEAEKKIEWLKSQDEQNRIYERQERKDCSDLWNQTAQTETLEESLLFQLSDLKLSLKEQETLEYMIQNLEESGYLELPLSQIAATADMPVEQVEKLLKILQSLEPDGIGARSLEECICIQLKKKYPEDQTALKIASDYLTALGKNQLPLLSRKLNVPIKEVQRAWEVIRHLNPRPGASFGEREFMQYVVPDIIIVKFAGYFDVLINDSEHLPIRFNDYYLNLIKAGGSDEASSYLAEKKKQIDWVRDCIEKRNQTLLSLVRLIVEEQQDFFRHGPGFLKPFSQSLAAQKLQVHESVVSRAIKDKFLQCSFGIFPLRYFFIQGLEHKESIKRRLREMISEEDKGHPLSDGALAARLLEENIRVSKRMVSKYRNELSLPDASGRKIYN